MRIARIQTAAGPVTGKYVDGAVKTEDGDSYSVGDEGTLLPPCEPSTLYCAGRNYQDYLEHKGNERPTTPHFFLKPPAALLAPERSIPYPTFAEGVGYAGELAAVMGEDSRNLNTDEALDVVLGYTIMNDVDALGEEGAGMKVFEAAAPLGPWIETDVDPDGLDLETRVGGEIRQEGNTGEMLFSAAEIISFLSSRITLHQGDIVALGSPANPGEVEPGEEVEIWYEGIGTLVNDLASPDSP
ncbi:fumarylacetoacetate hydrolase family protein [Halegenticoccus tardaugens]|uniref:fumarylacetoacetate hydrolase family protein n=1 Tax=Halegenticoccus tardaugens TaxID=2071624 RepID=UPI00100B4E8E|nr:fumarylacetoacetate hydrolase family protein [Halegenticoccus tardaugens]